MATNFQIKMNCKNCNTELNPIDNYCNNCGAKIIKERITLKYLFSILLSSLGWDNRFFITFKDLITKPQFVVSKYLQGTRKKYTSPFTFFAIITTVSVLLFSFYFEELVERSADMANIGEEMVIKPSSDNIDMNKSLEINQKKIEFIENMMSYVYKNYYYFSFLFLPVYTFIAFLVFGKPDNYAEHLIINTYIQGQIAILGLFLFVIALVVHNTNLHLNGTFVLTFFYYSYVYKKYRSYSFGALVARILKFFAILLILIIFLVIVGIIIGIIISVSR